MKPIKYLLVLILLSAIACQVEVDDKIRKEFMSRIKTLLRKRGSFNYQNTVLSPISFDNKRFIIDKVELNNVKINEIGKRYNLEAKTLEQIRAAFFQSQPNIYVDFEFSLNDNLDKVVNKTKFTEYIGCSFKQNNVVNYIILSLTVNVQIYEKKEIDQQWCLTWPLGDALRKTCTQNPDAFGCFKTKFDEKTCPKKEDQYTSYKLRPLNASEREQANKLISAYSGEIFSLMIEENEKQIIKIPDNLVVQSVFYTGQVFSNASYFVEARIADYGDVEIRPTGKRLMIFPLVETSHCLLLKTCKNLAFLTYTDVKIKKCEYVPNCLERESEYLIADKNGEGSCTKIKQSMKNKKSIKMEVYNDGSMAVKDGTTGGVLYYAKPKVQGKGPFSIGVTKEFELQIIDSKNVVVWKSTPVNLHFVKIKN